MIHLHLVRVAEISAWLAHQPKATHDWLAQHGFKEAVAGKYFTIPSPDASSIAQAVAVIEENPNIWSLGNASADLPAGDYALTEEGMDKALLQELALGWHLGQYRFTRYLKNDAPQARLFSPMPDIALKEGVFLARDLINTPPMDMMPEDISAQVKLLAKKHKAKFKEVVGDALLKKNYPMIHAVGRASTHKPRLIELLWGDAKAPKVTLIGKGVCFDSGGLDIKPSSAMKLMKKDMGGAAIVLGLAHVIMSHKLPIRLRVLIPAVENAISGNAFRTSDILPSRKGLTVEVGNTDAEGRLILADAMADADSEHPEVMIDFATLTGAARIALGAELPALFSNDETVGAEICAISQAICDPLWQLPLWQDYKRHIKSPIADIHSTGDDGIGGAIIAALFLQSFTEHATLWVHIDTMAWNSAPRLGRPKGGEAMGMRGIFAWLKRRYGEGKP